MKVNIVRIILISFIAVFLLQTNINLAATDESSGLLQPGTASGKLKVNVQTFKMKFAYMRSIEKEDGAEGASYLVLVTNRKFPYDLSKLTRFELDKYMQRSDVQGIDIGIDEHQNLMFIDILRAPKMIIDAQFAPEDRKQGRVAGRIFTNGEVRYFRNKVKFNAKLQS
jgi:hypothetical protein